MAKKSSRPNWILRIAGVLLCLTMLSMHLTSGMVARYSTTASATDSARVAIFNVTESGTFSQELPLEWYPGLNNEDEPYTVVVQNSSEVRVKCTLSVKRLSNNLPISVTIDGVDLTEKAVSAEFAPNDTSGMTYNLVVDWDGSNDAMYAGEVDAFRVVLHAEQVD